MVDRRARSCGRSIGDLDIRETTGAMIVALRRGSGAFVATPAPDAVLDAGDVLIGVGSADEIGRLEELFAPREPGVA